LPDQPPEAVQALALAPHQIKVELAPLSMVLGWAIKLMVGAGAVTEMVADCATLPPGPSQVKT
jgi:hypothetical protein